MKLRNILQVSLIVIIVYILLSTVLIVIQQANMPIQGRVNLLAVSKSSNKGAVASLFLETRQGTGNIFIDSLPITKADTQVATRFAQKIACDILDRDCSNKDFFYYLRSDSAIVGGTSAGAATTLLTIATLENIPLNDNVVITGTINSGGLIGPVGGVREKIIAAAEYNFSTVLIPKWSDVKPSSDLNLTNMTEYNNSDYDTEHEIAKLEEIYDIDIVPVGNIIDALGYFTDEDIDVSDYYMQQNTAIQLPDLYSVTMKNVSELLCARYKFLNESEFDGNYEELTNKSDEFYKKALNASRRYKYYSTASYCFSANLKLQEAINKNLTQDELKTKLNNVYKRTKAFDLLLQNISIKTMTDLEAKIITNQRIQETYNELNEIDPLNISSDGLSHAIERFISARVWSIFFGKGNTNIELNDESLLYTCDTKLAEASEKVNYLTLLLRIDHESAQKQLKYANSQKDKGNYDLCIFGAIKAKAEADAIINSMFISDEDRLEVLNERENHIAQIIAEEHSRGFFPLLGYSYYEYASDLKYEKTIAAMLYQEYAMEFSKLSIYLREKENKTYLLLPIKTESLFLVTIGILIGLVLSIFFPNEEIKPKKNSKKKNKPGKPPTTKSRRQSSRKKR